MKYLTFVGIALAWQLGFSESKGGGLVSPEVAVKYLQDSAVIVLDVRTPAEWEAGVLEGATLINAYDPNFEESVAKLDKLRPVLVYCAVGGRSSSVSSYLKSLKFSKVMDLKGGIRAWIAFAAM